jgi:K+-sensing histidine kinase KdpD
MTAGAILLERLQLANVVMLYLLGVLGIAVRLVRGPSILASILSVAAFDWLFAPPCGTFQVADGEYFVVFDGHAGRRAADRDADNTVAPTGTGITSA